MMITSTNLPMNPQKSPVGTAVITFFQKYFT